MIVCDMGQGFGVPVGIVACCVSFTLAVCGCVRIGVCSSRGVCIMCAGVPVYCVRGLNPLYMCHYC
jgi:hypothetical protein